MHRFLCVYILCIYYRFLLCNYCDAYMQCIIFLTVFVFFSSVISALYFLIYSVSLLIFSLCSCFLTSVSIFMTVILNSLSGKLHISISFIKICFWSFILFLYFGTYFSIFFCFGVSLRSGVTADAWEGMRSVTGNHTFHSSELSPDITPGIS